MINPDTLVGEGFISCRRLIPLSKIIAQVAENNQILLPSGVYWFHYFLRGKIDPSIFLELDLPVPTVITYFSRGSVSYAWAIQGYFGTQKLQSMLRDTKDKLMALFAHNGLDYQDIGYSTPNIETKNTRFTNVIYKPADFVRSIEDHRIKTIEQKWKKELSIALKLNGKKSLIDELFENCRKDIYALKRVDRLNYENVYSILENANRSYFQNKACRSDIKCKAQNMFEWTRDNYNSRNSRVKSTRTPEEIKVTRQERAITNAENKAKTAQAKIIGAVEAMKFLQEKITVRAVAAYAQVSKNTAEKYLKGISY